MAGRALPPIQAADARGLPRVPWPWIVVIAWLFAWPGWFLWNVAALMDVSLWTCLMALTVRECIALIYKQSVRSSDLNMLSLLLALLVLTRPESLVWAPFFIVSVAGLLRWRDVDVWPAIGRPLAAFVITQGVLTLFRLAYFGYPLPNTYYAKISPDLLYRVNEGWEYLADFLTGGGFAALGVIVALGWCLSHLPRLWALIRTGRGFETVQSLILFFLSAYVTLAVLIVLQVGGDHFGGWRLLQIVYPLLPVFLAFLWAHFRGPAAAASARALTLPLAAFWTVLALVVLTLPLRSGWFKVNRTHLLLEFHVAEEGRATAAALRTLLGAQAGADIPTVAITAAGGFAYDWKGSVLDLMGLNTAAMAHAPGERRGFHGHAAFNKDVFYAAAPEIVIPHVTGWPKILRDCKQLRETKSFYGKVLQGLQNDPEFRRLYMLVEFPIESRQLCMYMRRDYLQALQAAGQLQK
jgi:hypothetical protein